MFGEYVREAAVLVLVFVPLDFWKHNEITWPRMGMVLGFSGFLFAVGSALEWTSYAVRWGRTVWQKEEG